MTAILQADHVHHTFTAANGQTIIALEDVSLALSPGTFTALIGPSGCGKSTLLRILAGLVKPTSGQVQFGGLPLHRPQRQISMIFQKDNLMPWRTVYENIELPLQLAGVSKNEREQRVARLLYVTGLLGFENQFPAELSGGMAQRVAIARGLVNEPDVLLMDEPFGALDALTREQMGQELLRIWSTTQATVVMVTHSISEAVFLADRVLVMSPRPGHFIREVTVPFTRPRSIELLTDSTFTLLEAQIRAAIH
ncbi:MAG: ABC transporter ATP-binding protein [Chloroflexi bacterium]|nr:ABC transporter ATP-binding protein [Chloroflexota bacterium]